MLIRDKLGSPVKFGAVFYKYSDSQRMYLHYEENFYCVIKWWITAVRSIGGCR